MKSIANKKPSSASRSPFPPAGQARTRILLVDDHRVLRESMRILIEERSNFEVCGEADNASKAIELAGRLAPDITVTDVSLGAANGIELTKALRAQAPALRILMVSMHEEQVYAERAVRAGAMGYLGKDRAGEELITAIQCLMAGGIYLSDQLKAKLVHQFLNQSPTGEKLDALAGTLSDREREVLNLIGNGVGTRVIADKLKLSAKTVDSYRDYMDLQYKLGTNSELVRCAIQWIHSQDGR